MVMETKYVVPIIRVYHGLLELAPLTFEVGAWVTLFDSWYGIWIDNGIEASR